MLHEKSCLIINMPKIMIIKYLQFAKTNTFSLSFQMLFSHFFPRHIEIRIWGWAKMGKNGVGPPKNYTVMCFQLLVAVFIINICNIITISNDQNSKIVAKSHCSKIIKTDRYLILTKKIEISEIS